MPDIMFRSLACCMINYTIHQDNWQNLNDFWFVKISKIIKKHNIKIYIVDKAGKWKTVQTNPLLTSSLPNSSPLFDFSTNKYDDSETEESHFP